MTAHAKLLAVCDPAFQTAGAVRFANELTRLGIVINLIVHLRTRQAACRRASTDRHSFDSRNRHYSLSKKAIELQVPGRVRTQSGHDATSRNFENPTERISFSAFLINEFDHLFLDLNISAMQGRVIRY